MRINVALLAASLAMAPLMACNALYDFKFAEETGSGGASASSSSASGSGGASSAVGTGVGGASSSSSGVGGSTSGGGEGGAGGAVQLCGNGKIDGDEQCDLAGGTASWCVDCMAKCPTLTGAAVRVGEPDEPHCYTGVPEGTKSEASSACASLGSGWFLLELSDLDEHDWLHANRAAIGISGSKYFWTGAVEVSGGQWAHPRGKQYPYNAGCSPPGGVWADGEPCDLNDDPCTLLGLSDNDPGLNDAPCSGSMYASEGICEWEP
jgi:hypothetical protein